MKTVKQVAKEVNRAPSTVIRWVAEIGTTPDGINSLLTGTVEAWVKEVAAKRRRVIRGNSKLYAGGIQQTLKLDSEQQAGATPEKPKEEGSPENWRATKVIKEIEQERAEARNMVALSDRFCAMAELLEVNPADLAARVLGNYVSRAVSSMEVYK